MSERTDQCSTAESALILNVSNEEDDAVTMEVTWRVMNESQILENHLLYSGATDLLKVWSK